MAAMLKHPSSLRELTQVPKSPRRPPLSSALDLIDAARAGRISIILDDHGPQVQGCLILPAQFATPDAVNFMAAEGRGLICLALEGARIAELGIEMIPHRHGDQIRQPAFTVSIEAREGVSTGISASDRARTIRVAIDPAKAREDIVSPGHVFPIAAHDAGVLAYPNYTEAGLDIARLAGLAPSAVGCRILADDGNVAGLSELFDIAGRHGLCIGRIADLVCYRRRHDHPIEKVEERRFDSVHGGSWIAHRYRSKANGLSGSALLTEHLDLARPIPLLLHDFDPYRDALGSRPGEADSLARAMDRLSRTGGAIITDFDPALGHHAPGLLPEMGDVGIGAEILALLGLTRVTPAEGCERHPAFLAGGTLEQLGFAISRGHAE